MARRLALAEVSPPPTRGWMMMCRKPGFSGSNPMPAAESNNHWPQEPSE